APLVGGRYQLVKQLDADSCWQTSLARDLHLPDRADCIVKQLNPSASSGQAFQSAKLRLEMEATVLSQLRHHPCIPRLLAHCETGPQPYLVRELVEGHSIQADFAKPLPWSDRQVMVFLGDLLGTLAFVHQSHIIHGNLKPSALIRRHLDCRIVPISFGAATQSKATSAVAAISSPHPSLVFCSDHSDYVPAEQAAGHTQFSSDIYAVGLIAIQALTGHQASTFSTQADTEEICWRSLVSRRNPPSSALLEYLDSMVRPDFRDRYATATEALSALNSLPSELSKFILPSAPHAHSSVALLGTLKEQELSEAQPTLSAKQTSTAPKVTLKRSFQKLVLSASIGLVVSLGLGTLIWRASTSVFRVEGADTASASPRSDQRASRVEEAEPNAFLPEPTPLGETAVKLPDQTAVESAVPPADRLSEAADQALPPTETTNQVGVPEDIEARALTSRTATAVVEDFYNYAANQSWDAARAMFGADLAKRFDPGFFKQFQQVSVENLRVTNQTAKTVEMVGHNTYVYPDGSTQQEERTFTVQMINGWPSIVATSFVQVTKARQ
ncbi:MAG: protein kinase, partial [Phormidesmis sp.]